MVNLDRWQIIRGVFLLFTMAATLPAQTLTTLYTFTGSNRAEIYTGLIQGTDGNLYGMTDTGGAGGGCTGGCGTIFKITASGAFTTLYNFCSQVNCADGDHPFGGALIQATDGNFYGTTLYGGINSSCKSGNGCGTVFKITASGELTTLHSFGLDDGQYPQGGLVQGTDGNFYGVTVFGGTSQFCVSYYGLTGCGAIFKITPRGTLTTLYSFCPAGRNCADGENPFGLVQGSDGNFYGTTGAGGTDRLGTVFKITPTGHLTSLYSFCPETSCTDGYMPQAGLVQGRDGNFYGTTYLGGINQAGTIFKITPSGSLTSLYSFCSDPSTCTDGESPYSALIQATDGRFYGTTYDGGDNSNGTLFSITPTGALTTLYRFPNVSTGASPAAALVQDTSGEFFGTTAGELIGANATIFGLSTGLGPFVKPQTTSGMVGTHIKILGTNLTGAAAVMFNGTAATFTVKSKSEIITTVPTGATTGTVQVVTPSGTLSSNVPFTVKP
jgi:uncharacterized repeat protein (TIGR03803 family)